MHASVTFAAKSGTVAIFIVFLKKIKKISAATPGSAKCCCQDFNSHEADADAECHSSLEGVTLDSPVKKKESN